jgi:hypothetical protein
MHVARTVASDLMQTRSVSTGPGVEIACDESGFSGSNLVRTDAKVFTHASVRLTTADAARCVDEVRDGDADPAREYKSAHLLRTRDRTLLTRLLGPTGPLFGNAHVHLTDKTYFVVERVTCLVLGVPSSPLRAGLWPGPRVTRFAVTLHRDGPGTFGDGHWQEFLEASNAVLVGRTSRDGTAPVDGFFRVVDALCASGVDGDVGRIMRMLQRAEPGEHTARGRLLHDPKEVPATDLFVPAIIRAVAHWSARVGPVTIVHDEQSALTRRRIAQLQRILLDPRAAAPRSTPPHPMSGLRGADSRTDPRVQLADLLAGLARRIASDELAGRGDPELTALLRPYVDPASIWQDDRSWSALRPASGECFDGRRQSSRWRTRRAPGGSSKPS